MARPMRRLRGLLLRLALDRRLAVVVGLCLSGPAMWLLVADYRWESWITDAVGLVLGATGVAMVLAGLSGRRPDWTE